MRPNANGFLVCYDEAAAKQGLLNVLRGFAVDKTIDEGCDGSEEARKSDRSRGLIPSALPSRDCRERT